MRFRFLLSLGRLTGLWLAALVLQVGVAGTTHAANVSVVNNSGLPPIIVIEGNFEAGDDKKFVQVALPFDQAIVALDSAGGNVLAAIEIGRAIRLKQFTTFVPPDHYCASACGLAWLGGTKRVMASTAHVGFHAAYVDEGGQLRETGAGNAIVGAYLNQLGLSQNAIAYLTSSPPNSLQWLSANDARQLGIEIEIYEPNVATNTPKAPNDDVQQSQPRVDVEPSQPRVDLQPNETHVDVEPIRKKDDARLSEAEQANHTKM